MIRGQRESTGRHAAPQSMRLVLQDGSIWPGQRFGADREVRGEAIFHTGTSGYPESLSAPSDCGQILVLTDPLIGNYGVPMGRFESPRVQVQGLIVARSAPQHSHHDALRSLGDWLARPASQRSLQSIRAR